MKQITSIRELRTAISDVISYNWGAEAADYLDTASEMGLPDAHIFATLVVLDNWVHGSKRTPEFYVKVRKKRDAD